MTAYALNTYDDLYRYEDTPPPRCDMVWKGAAGALPTEIWSLAPDQNLDHGSPLKAGLRAGCQCVMNRARRCALRKCMRSGTGHFIEITAAAVSDDGAVRTGAHDMKTAFRGVAAVRSRADQCAADNMAIDMRLKDDRLPYGRDTISASCRGHRNT